MSRAGSFALALVLLLATLVAAAWGLQRVDLSAWQARGAYAALDARGVCAYTSGHERQMLTAVEIADARAVFARAGADTCPYLGDPLALPSAAEQAEARGAAERARADICPYDPSHRTGLLSPDDARQAQAAAQAGSGGAPIAAIAAIAAAVGALGYAALRLLRRRAAAAAVAASSAVRNTRWLTPRRIAIGIAGWLVTVGVLAASYPTLSQYIPRIPGLNAAETPWTAPAAPGPKQAASPEAAPAPVEVAVEEAQGPVALAPLPPVPDALANPASADGAAPLSPLASPSFPGFSGPSVASSSTAAASAIAASTAAADESPATASAVPTLPTTSLASIAATLPPASTQPAAAAATPAAVAPAATETPAAATPAVVPPRRAAPALSTAPLAPGLTQDQPASAPAAVTPVFDDAREAIATSPIIDSANPLPSSPDAVLPAPPVRVASDGGDAPQTAPPPVATVPANPIAQDDVAPDADDGATPVPEPAMLGLFGFGALAVLRRRRARN